jgi:GMP synthase (glutamine-hydrolysing) A subunit
MKITIFEQWEDRYTGLENFIEKENTEIIRTYKNEKIPNADEINALILSGGPQSLTEIKKYKILEKQLPIIKKIAESGKPILGICLGHQLLALSLGGEVRKSQTPEIGWYKLQLNNEGKQNRLYQEINPVFQSFEFHYDEVSSLPNQFKILAKSENCKIQAYQYKNFPVWGVQYHPEVNIKRSIEIINKYTDKTISKINVNTYASEQLIKNFVDIVNGKHYK